MAQESGPVAGRYEVDIEEVEYLRHGDKPLLASIYKPRGPGPFPAVIEMHGGAWCMGDRKVNHPMNRPIASGGVVIAALDFRAPPDAGSHSTAGPGQVPREQGDGLGALGVVLRDGRLAERG